MKWRTLQPTTLFKLLELVTYWDPCKELVINWRFVHQRKEDYYKIKSNWVLEWRFNCRLIFRDKSGWLVRFLIFVIAWLLISGFLGVVTLKSPGGVFALRGLSLCQQIIMSILFSAAFNILVICWCLHDLHVIESN